MWIQILMGFAYSWWGILIEFVLIVNAGLGWYLRGDMAYLALYRTGDQIRKAEITDRSQVVRRLRQIRNRYRFWCLLTGIFDAWYMAGKGHWGHPTTEDPDDRDPFSESFTKKAMEWWRAQHASHMPVMT